MILIVGFEHRCYCKQYEQGREVDTPLSSVEEFWSQEWESGFALGLDNPVHGFALRCVALHCVGSGCGSQCYISLVYCI